MGDASNRRNGPETAWAIRIRRPAGLAAAILAVATIVLIAEGLRPGPAQAQTPATGAKALLELTPPDDSGFFYTLDPWEAYLRVGTLDFQMQPPELGYLWDDSVSGTLPLYRLSTKSGYGSRLLTLSPAEREALLDSGNFVDEGVIGYAINPLAPPADGTTMLWRYSRDSRWRVVLDPQRSELEQAGWSLDGPLGYALVSQQPGGPSPSPPPGQPSGNPCDPSPPLSERRLRAAITQSHGRKRGRAITTDYGRPVRIEGRLTGTGGKPIAGVRVCIVARDDSVGAKRHRIAIVTTDAEGRFRRRIGKGPSRRIWLVHRQGATATATSVMLRVRAPLSFHPSRRKLSNGQAVVLKGRLQEAPRSRGTLVELQARRPSRWQTFATTKTNNKGRYRYRYRFTRTVGVQVYRLRARMPSQRGHPFATGTSKAAKIKVVGR